jgi:hypothetical protein
MGEESGRAKWDSNPKTFICRTNLTAKTAGVFQTKERDEFTERLGCASKGMSFGTGSG